MLLAVLVAAAIASCGSGNAADTTSVDTAQAKALDQMTTTFRGSPSVSLIEEELRTSFGLYGLPWTEDNRSRAGSVLVTLEDELDVAEMSILRLMNCSPEVADQGVEWPEAAALAGSFVASGDAC